MSPKSFTFKLTVPKAPQAVALVTDVATHAVTYAELGADLGPAFVDRVTAIATIVLQTPDKLPSCLIVVTSDEAALTFTIGQETVSQPHAA